MVRRSRLPKRGHARTTASPGHIYNRRSGSAKAQVTHGRLSLDYQTYIRSKRWARKKHRAKENHPYCEACGRNIDLQVHHRTYARLGKELPGDLVVLCEDHHVIVHRYQAEQRCSIAEATAAVIGTGAGSGPWVRQPFKPPPHVPANQRGYQTSVDLAIAAVRERQSKDL